MTEVKVIDISVKPIAGFGARVFISPEHLLDDGVAEKCLNLLNEHNVLVFPEISISDETQSAFSNRMGKMHASKPRSLSETEANPFGIYPVSLDPKHVKYLDYIKSNEHWHMDGTSSETPPKATNLKCEVPPSEGGDTEFANLYAAYEDLPEARKIQMETLLVVHSVEAANLKTFKNPTQEDLQRWRVDGPPIVRPLVWKQTDGRKSLVIGSMADHIVGMDLDKGRALLDELLQWCTQPKYCYRHQWQKGDMVIWNNPGLLHRAHPYTAESGRLMHRTTIMGAEMIA